MKTKTYAKAPTRIGKLHDELLAAGIAPENVSAAGAGIAIAVADTVLWATVDPIVAAHDPTTPSAAEQQATADATSLSDLTALYTSALVQIGNDRTQIASGVTSLADAAWLTLTALQKADRNRTVLQGVLTVLDNLCMRDQAQLKALRVIVRRQGA